MGLYYKLGTLEVILLCLPGKNIQLNMYQPKAHFRRNEGGEPSGLEQW